MKMRSRFAGMKKVRFDNVVCWKCDGCPRVFYNESGICPYCGHHNADK